MAIILLWFYEYCWTLNTVRPKQFRTLEKTNKMLSNQNIIKCNWLHYDYINIVEIQYHYIFSWAIYLIMCFIYIFIHI